jgi:hypothetical protein
VRVTAHDVGVRAELEPGESVTFGRSSGCELTFPDDPRLSRRAGRIRHLGPAVEVSNLSVSHSLFVQSQGSPRERLLPAQADAALSSRLLAAGSHEITSRHSGTSGCRILVEVSALTSSDSLGPYPTGDRLRTHVALVLNPATKEFATALVLCRDKLLHGPTAAVPSVPELTRAVLRATGSRHLLARFEQTTRSAGPGAGGRRPRNDRDRLVGRIHDHLKQLREKVYTAGLSTTRELRPHELADVLIENDVIMPAQLELLHDADWLTTQEELWWQT